MAAMTIETTPTQIDFGGLVVAAFESRRASEMDSLISRHGGRPRVAPSMREVPLEDDCAVAEFVRRLLDGQIDVLLLLTGVGTYAVAAWLLRIKELRVVFDRKRTLQARAESDAE